MAILNAAERWVAVALRALAVILLVAIVATIAVQIVSRSLLHTPAIWTEEAARFALIWLTALGCSWLAFSSSHIGLGLGQAYVGTRLGRAREVLVRVISLTVIAYFAVTSIEVLDSFRTASPALRLPMSIVYACIPVGMTAWSLHELLALIRVLMSRPPLNPLAGASMAAEELIEIDAEETAETAAERKEIR